MNTYVKVSTPNYQLENKSHVKTIGIPDGYYPAKIIVALAIAVIALTLSGCLSVMPMVAPSAKNIEPDISGEFPFESKYVEVLGSNMHYIDEGTGPTVVLVHGNPTSSYLWRNVVPRLTGKFRVIALDLIGMGKSDRPDLDYRFPDHARYFSGFMEEMELEDVALVLHDWGGGVGLDYAAQNSSNVRAIAVMEAVVKPMRWEMADLPTRYLFGRLRDPEDGYKIAAVNNYFVERILPMMSGRDFTDEEMSVYRSPYPTIESRKLIAQWPREIPFDDGPEDNVKRISANYEWLKNSDVPVLAMHASPGAIFKKGFMEELRSELPRMQVVDLGSGIHYLQEVQPTLIGDSVAGWLANLDGAQLGAQ